MVVFLWADAQSTVAEGDGGGAVENMGGGYIW